jgi:hypothetical protein
VAPGYELVEVPHREVGVDTALEPTDLLDELWLQAGRLAFPVRRPRNPSISKSSYRSRSRRMCRAVTRQMLAACVHVIFFSSAFLMTSSLAIIRAFLATGSSRISYGYPSCLCDRTSRTAYDPDISCVTDTGE